MRGRCSLGCAILFVCGSLMPMRADEVAALRLIPFPKKVERQSGEFHLNRPLTLEWTTQAGPVAAKIVLEEIKRAGLPAPELVRVEAATSGFRLSRVRGGAFPPAESWPGKSEETYRLRIAADEIVARACAGRRGSMPLKPLRSSSAPIAAAMPCRVSRSATRRRFAGGRFRTT